jgi:hypothetical protein
MIAFYIKGMPNSTPVKLKLFSAQTKNEIENILNQIEL